MAQILIKNMEMPKTCAACRLFAVNKLYNGFTDMFEKHAFCTANHSIRFEEFDIDNIRHGACPLIELPPHGDLIERKETVQKLMDVMCEGCKHTDDCGWCAMAEYRRIVENAPTVIPASGGE